MADREDLLRTLYAAFNARDVDTVLAHLAPNVDWPNGWEGGRVHGRAAVADYWRRQWAEIDSHAEPTAITARPDGRTAVDVDLTINGPDGTVVSDDQAVHVYTFDADDLVTTMEIEPSEGS